MQVFLKLAYPVFSPIYVLLIRALSLLLINSLIIRKMGLTLSIKDPSTNRILIKRSMLATLTPVLYLISVVHLPIGIVSSLLNLGPILIFFI